MDHAEFLRETEGLPDPFSPLQRRLMGHELERTLGELAETPDQMIVELVAITAKWTLRAARSYAWGWVEQIQEREGMLLCLLREQGRRIAKLEHRLGIDTEGRRDHEHAWTH